MIFIGQRSQIYIRLKDRNNNKYLFAKYYDWNYGERMISRARYGIDYIKRNLDYSIDDELVEQINRMFDVNFDMKDVQLSDNIITWLENEYLTNQKDINEFIFFEPENNDGKLFVDCDQNSKKIKYCFTDGGNIPLSAQEYMKWNIGFGWDKKDFSDDPDWNKISATCKKNIKAIKNDAELMSDIELKQFINDDYTKYINEVFVENNIKI